MEGITRLAARAGQILRGFAYPPSGQVRFDGETVLMALTDSRTLFSTALWNYPVAVSTGVTDLERKFSRNRSAKSQISRYTIANTPEGKFLVHLLRA
jgi:hypothetical protein